MTEYEQRSATRSVGLFDEVSDLLIWAQNRVGPLTFIGLMLAAWLWLDFLRVTGLPVGFLSPTSVVALPILFMVVAMAVIVLWVGAVLPSLALWAPLFEGGPSIVSLGRRYASRGDQDWTSALDDFAQPLTAAEAAVFRWGLIKRWLVFSAMTFAVGPVLIAYGVWHGGRLTGWSDLLAMAVLTVPAVIVFARLLGKATGRRPSWEFMGNFGWASSLQVLVSLMMSVGLLQAFPAQSVDQLAPALVAYLIGVVVIGAAQIAISVRMAKGLYRDLFKHVFMGAIGLMGLVTVIQPLGGRLVTYPLQLESPDGQACMVLGLTHDASKPDMIDAAILAPSGRPQTRELDFAILLDGTYYLRTAATGRAVFMIPVNRVSRVQDCPLKTPSASKRPAVVPGAGSGSTAASRT